jgi:hypothetical protein
MRRLILISVLALASVTAQAGQQRGLALASNDERIESVAPEQRPAPVKSEAARPVRETPAPVKQVSKPPKLAARLPRLASSPANQVRVRGYENQEAEARRIAATYGVSW